MARQSNAAPVIVKRKKIVAAGGHHGGAWKVAYADFVTAMMAFFLLMWLLNATTERQRKGLADYFNPTIPVNRISGGGEGMFGGQSVFSEQTVAQMGTGGSMARPTEERQARGETGVDPAAEDGAAEAEETRALRAIEERLMGRGGESFVSENLLRHIVTEVTDEGLIVELFDVPGTPLFVADGDAPTPLAAALAGVIAEAFAVVGNGIAVQGHTRAYPIVLQVNPVWDLSAARAQALRRLLAGAGLAEARVQRVTGFADRRPVVADPMAARNNRLEVILLRHRR